MVGGSGKFRSGRNAQCCLLIAAARYLPLFSMHAEEATETPLSLRSDWPDRLWGMGH
jgi:hypothetical protein